MANFPTLEEAKKIWESGIAYRLEHDKTFLIEGEYRFHTLGVAQTAKKISELIPSLNPEKAYIMGLLHDYGKRINERLEDKFHGQDGYEQMLKMGYPEIAQICLSHSFPEHQIDYTQYGYPKHWLDWCQEKLNYITYTDYDLLIAFCDKLFEGYSMVSVEERVAGITRRYHLTSEQSESLYSQSLTLKQYFDDKTGVNVYQLLGIKTHDTKF